MDRNPFFSGTLHHSSPKRLHGTAGSRMACSLWNRLGLPLCKISDGASIRYVYEDAAPPNGNEPVWCGNI